VSEDVRCDVVFEIICDDDAGGIPKNTESFTEWVSNTTVYSSIMMGMQFTPKVIMHLYDVETITGGIRDLIKQRIHPKMKEDPIDFMKISKKLWKPY
jgi:hypothetical protein